MSTVAEQPKRKLEEDAGAASSEPESKVAKTDDDMKVLKRGPISKAREIRLEQNRKAARESRRRKKTMIEELQRSVIFFSRSNGVLKQQNEDLQRMLMNARAQVAQIEGQQGPTNTPAAPSAAPVKDGESQKEQAAANAVATQAKFESQGFPAAAARAAAQTMNGTAEASATAAPAKSIADAADHSLPPMQPGATMQAMANFQQAAVVAMQQAVKGMEKIPGVSITALAAAAPTGANTYSDTMTALAMQQAATAAGQPGFGFQHSFPVVAWQQSQHKPPASNPAPQS